MGGGGGGREAERGGGECGDFALRLFSLARGRGEAEGKSRTGMAEKRCA